MSGSIVYPFGNPQADPSAQRVRVPDQTWDLDGGWGWVYRGPGNDQLQQPLIMSDGFHPGESDRTALYWGFENNGDYRFITELNQRGYDVVVLGYRDCSRSILENADTAMQCIWRALAESVTDRPFVVGGFSMGGLITRYALAKMETMRLDHRTSHFFAYDSPHLGAWIPISLQSLAYYIQYSNASLRDLINSPAAKEMLWRLKLDQAGIPATQPERLSFLERLHRFGDWPSRPLKIGVANGSGHSEGNGNPPEAVALRSILGASTTELHVQSQGDSKLVAKLRGGLLPVDKYTSGYPELDSAPGGLLDSFGIAAAALNDVSGISAEAPYPHVNFVPAISALAVHDADIGKQDDLFMNIDSLDEGRFEFDVYRASSSNTGHTEITRELCEFIIEHLQK